MRPGQKRITIGILISLVLAFGAALALTLALGTDTAAQAGASHKSGTPITSPTQKQPPLPRFTTAPPAGTVAHTASQALTLAMPYFFGIGSSWGVHQISSIAYVKTTANDALAVLGPHAQGAENSTAPAWLLVAKGIFQSARGCVPVHATDLQ